MSDDYIDQEVIANFLDEAGQCVATLNEKLLDVENGDVSPASIDEMFRAAHSMKGAAGFLNFTSIGKVTHSMETVLDKIRKNELFFNPAILDALFSALDVISTLLAGLLAGEDGEMEISATVEALEALLQKDKPKEAEVEPCYSEDPESGLGPLPDFLKGRLELDDILDILVAVNLGKQVHVIRVSLNRIISNHQDPIYLYHLLENCLYIQTTVPLIEQDHSIWMNLDDYVCTVAIVCIVEKDDTISELLTKVSFPPCEIWRICTEDNELGKPVNFQPAALEIQPMETTEGALTIKESMLKHRSTWLSETREELEQLEAALMDYENDVENPAHLNTVFRLMHRLKGASATMSLDAITRVTHNCETVLANIRDTDTAPDETLFQLLYCVKDYLNTCLEHVDADNPAIPGTGNIEEFFKSYIETDSSRKSDGVTKRSWHPSETALNAVDEAFAAGGTVWHIEAELYEETPLADIRYGMIVRNIETIAEVLTSEPSLIELERGMENPPSLHVLASSSASEEALREAVDIDMVQHVRLEKMAKPEARKDTANQAKATTATGGGGNLNADTLRVDTAKIDQLMNISGELAITKARIVQLIDMVNSQFRLSDITAIEKQLSALSLNPDEQAGDRDTPLTKVMHWLDALKSTQKTILDLRDASLMLHRNTSLMQNSVMQIRMVPIGPLFQRFHRLVRDICKENDKKAKLVTAGENTELDKKLIDELADPLTHLIRNSVDHGLETVEQRLAAGKPEQGTVRLEAFHENGQICIRIQDDGKGLVIEKIIEKAVKNRIVTEEAAKRMADQEIYQLIFQPGFSTAEKVTNISGRGVGMDIVKSKVAELKGKVDIESAPGKGCTFTIRVPLTLAMIQTLLVEVGQIRYAIPLESVREISEFALDEIKHVKGTGKVVSLRDEVIALIDLAETIGTKPMVSKGKALKTVVSKSSGSPFAIPVDKILGKDEIVVKPLSGEFAHVKGITGATVLGDGGIALILDVEAIKNQAMANQQGVA